MEQEKKRGYFNERGDAFFAGDGTRITELGGQSVRELRSATEFSLSKGDLTPAEWELLCSLDQLRILDLSGTIISALPDSIGQLTELQGLYLSNTNISALPDSIGQLAKLQNLNLSDTNISALPDSIGQLAELQVLDLSITNISALPDSIGQLAALQGLDLSGTNISALPDSIGQLAALQFLGLNNTSISALPDFIGQLAELKKLDLSGTKIAELPPALLERDPVFARSLDELFEHSLSEPDRLMILLDDVRLANPLIMDAIRQGMTGKAILERFYGNEGKRRLRECKVIFLGDGAVGKTTTIRRICGDGALTGIRQTPGIEIRTATLNPDGSVGDRGDPDGIRVHFWDFGGQEVLRSMHRCFLTERTVYAIVSNARQFDHRLSQSRAVYWLNSIRDFAKDRDSGGGRPSRVLLLMNCQENRDSFDLNELREGFSGCSSLQLPGEDGNLALDVVKASKEAVQNLVRQIYAAAKDYVDEYPLSWFRLRDELERETEGDNYLDAARYLELCDRCGVPEGDRETLLGILVDIGVVFRSRQKPELAEDYMVLRPIWLVNAIYAIIRAADPHGPTTEGAGPRSGEFADRNGVFSIGELVGLLKNHKAFSTLDPQTKTYSADEVYYVMDVMVQYGLAARIETDKTEKYFIPMLCDTDRPSKLSVPGKLQLAYRFDYGDSSSQNLFYRLMVQLYPDFRGPFWQNGCHVDVGDTKVQITRDYLDQKDETVLVSVYGADQAAARDALDLLRGLIEAENFEKGLRPKEHLTKAGLEAAGYDSSNGLPVSDLLDAYREGNKEIRIPGGPKHTPQELLEACLGRTGRLICRLTGGRRTTPERLSDALNRAAFAAAKGAGAENSAAARLASEKIRLLDDAMKDALQNKNPSLSYQKAQAEAVGDWFANTPEDELDHLSKYLRIGFAILDREAQAKGGDLRD